MNIVIIMQARTGSSRLPGKTLLPLLGKPLFVRQLERMSFASLPAKIVVATTKDESDDEIVKIAEKEGYPVYRGHATNLLDRHYRAALEHKADVVLKIPSDCPLIDPSVIDKVIRFYLYNQEKYDFVSNLHPATYPDGNDVEVMPFGILKEAWRNAEKNFELEHTTPYIWDNPKKYRIGNVEWETGLNYSMSHRFTIDYREDYDFIKRIYEELYTPERPFTLTEIIDLLETKPEIMKINNLYSGVNWYRNHVSELNTVRPEETRFVISGR